ncbi:MAG: hypothetical protein ACUVQ3_09065 [bacterium]
MVFILFVQYALAESLFAHAHYDLALVEYKRLFFFDTSAFNNFHLRFNYTIAVLNKDYYKGYEEIEKLLADFLDIDTASRIILGKALIQTGNYHMAINILQPTAEKRLLGFSYLFNKQYYNAIKEFQALDKNLAQEIEIFINRPEKSITRAMFFSAVLPGVGEIYAGDIRQGIQDFLLTSLSGLLLYNSIKNKHYLDAGIIFSFVFNRFYFGSISNAARIAQKTNERSTIQWFDYIKDKYLIPQWKN